MTIESDRRIGFFIRPPKACFPALVCNWAFVKNEKWIYGSIIRILSKMKKIKISEIFA